ncbi:EamA family transporter [Pseudomaricurvus hydrocarbonicus]
MSEKSAHLSPVELVAAMLVILLWGLNFVPMKFALLDFTPFQMGAARFLLAAFPLFLFVARPSIPMKWLLLYGFAQGLGQFSFLFFALKFGMSAALASVLMQTQVFFTALMGATLLGEPISRPLTVGMMVAAAGLACFVLNLFTDQGLGTVTELGFLLTLMAALMWSSANIIVKKMQASSEGYSALSLVAWSSLISGVGFVLISIVFDDHDAHDNWLQASATGWLSLLYLGWAASGLAYWLWTLLLTRHLASRVAPFSLGVPVVGLLAGIWVLDEQMTTMQWVGSALVMFALVVVVMGSRYSIERMTRRYTRRN